MENEYIQKEEWIYMAECRIFKLNNEGFKEVIPGMMYFKHLHGTNLSVALAKTTGNVPVKPNRHGEEVGIALKGWFKIFAGGKEYLIREGEAIITSPGLEHTGEFPTDEECIVVSMITPARVGARGNRNATFTRNKNGPVEKRLEHREADLGQNTEVDALTIVLVEPDAFTNL